MRVALLHPEWDRPCGACERFVYQDDGTLKRDRAGLPMARPAGVPTPCGTCEKVPRHARQTLLDWRQLRALAEELTPANRQAYAFYRRCRAVCRFPDDPLVAWYAELIRSVEDVADRAPVESLALGLAALTAALKGPTRRR